MITPGRAFLWSFLPDRQQGHLRAGVPAGLLFLVDGKVTSGAGTIFAKLSCMLRGRVARGQGGGVSLAGFLFLMFGKVTCGLASLRGGSQGHSWAGIPA